MTTVLYDELGPKALRRVRLGSIAAVAVLAFVAYVVVDRFAASGQLEARDWQQFTEPVVLEFLAKGLLANITAATIAGAAALALGAGLAVGRLSRSRLVRIPTTVYIEFFRGIPPLLVLFFLFFGLPVYGVHIGVMWVLVVGIALYNAALFAEVIRAGILALPKGQREAALAVGLRPHQAMARVVLPQALTAMIPALLSQMVVLFKDTTLGQLITYEELLRRGRLNAQAEQGTDLQNLIVVAAVFVAINLVLSLLASRLEARRLRRFKTTASPVPSLPA